MESLNERQQLFVLPEKTGALYHLKKNSEDKHETIPIKLKSKTAIAHDTFIFTFELPGDMYLGLNLGQHIAIDAFIPTEENPLGDSISRKYTPVSNIYQKGKFDLLIKVYYKNINPDFPLGGIMSQWLISQEVGSVLWARGPIGRLVYYGDGKFELGTKDKPVKWYTKTYKKVGMLCGGTGITPLYQILKAADEHKDTVEYSLLYGNRTARDILLKEELDRMHNDKNFNFKVKYTIDVGEEGWNGLVGYITKEMIEQNMPAPADDTLILLCGRGKMCKKFLAPLLMEMGHKKEDIHIF